MREIKFRAWDIGAEKMINEMSFAYIKGYMADEGCVDCTSHFFQTTSEKFDWMQYTGLKDKNGKEIYEGDILDWPTKYKMEDGVVRFEDGGFWLVRNYHGIQHNERHLPSKDYREIIGNIYENPELLNA